MRTISMKVPEKLDHDLAEVASRRGVSKSALLRDAITELIARESSPSRPAAGSFLAQAEDLAGCVEGPEDLSTREDYLDGYGR